MKLCTLSLMLICSMIVISGCATKNMANLRDCGKFYIGVGPGLGADVGVGCLTHPSLGLISYTLGYGVEDRYNYGRLSRMEDYFPGFFTVEGTYLQSYRCWVDSTHQESIKNSFWLNFCEKREPKRPYFIQATDVEVGASLLYVSVRAGVNPLGIARFLLGLCGIDMASELDGIDENPIKCQPPDRPHPPPPPTCTPVAPAQFSITTGTKHGELIGHWKRTPGAGFYYVGITTTPDQLNSWRVVTIVPGNSCTLTGLISGTTYYVRVNAYCSNQEGLFSSVQKAVAP